MKYCSCHDVLTPRAAMKHIVEEVQEFIEAPSMDEASDIAYGVGRLLGAFFKRPYVGVPGDTIHVRKIKVRMEEYGCIRSSRHLKNGECPSK